MVKSKSCCNSALINKNKLVRRAYTKGNNTPTSILTFFYAQISLFTLGPLDLYMDIDLQKTIRLVFELVVKSQKYG